MLIKNKNIMTDTNYELITKLEQETAERKIWMYSFAGCFGLLIGLAIHYKLIMDIFNLSAF